MSNSNNSKGVLGTLTGDGGSKESTSQRRRSSASSSAGKFAGLMDQKRNSSDMSAAQRKASFAEQQAPMGFFGGIWQSFTKGK